MTQRWGCYQSAIKNALGDFAESIFICPQSLVVDMVKFFNQK
jgi:hypothetical protein